MLTIVYCFFCWMVFLGLSEDLNPAFFSFLRLPYPFKGVTLLTIFKKRGLYSPC